ncbi:uncharacterized protein LOC131689149 isoform X2 [Topomyia yanbarensis]|uniref:uncharacterized protein LOC131689149 isoform X2 n=1 Tax=Topomyia yanbarensis TaxID=2498891 RepID=UPI00273B667F|nr:uncharacterized protein LOC131689149 isoform X2 [Topomyia yanbarensis]
MKADFNYKMRKEFEQSLDVCRLELNSLRHYKRPKRIDDDVEEYIDITGDYPSEPESIDRFQPKNLSYLKQPPSKIYYDSIEKESSDGGFFDRDDLDDEDEKNDLVIDCKLNGDVGEKKTDNGISHDSKGRLSTLTESDIVLNFTLVDTELVYNAPTIVQKLPYASETNIKPPVTFEIVPTSIPSNTQDIRLHPVQRRKNSLPYSTVNRAGQTRVPTVDHHSLTNVPSTEPIGSRLRPSAFSPPVKSQLQPQTQTVPLKPTIGPTHPAYYKSLKYTSLKAPQQRKSVTMPQQHSSFPSIGHYAKLPSDWRKPRQNGRVRDALENNKSSGTSSCLPPQFGFGSSMLSNLYDASQPLDFSKDSPLSQYEAMLKRSPQDQHLYGYSILRSLPIPEPPKPPSSALRPKLVSIRHHPTISKIHRPHRLRDILKTKPNIPIKPPPSQMVSESFRVHVRQEINAFFNRRQNEICSALRLFTTESIDISELFRRLDHFQIRVSRDYMGIAWTMIQRYGYRFQSEVPPVKLDYRWPERPQEIVEYFMKVRGTLRPHASEETLNIYRMVVGGLLEQFRDSIEYFLSRNLQR